MNAQPLVKDLFNEVNLLNSTANNALNKADNILADQQRTLFLNLTNYSSYLLGSLDYLSNDLDKKLKEKELALLYDLRAITIKLNNTQLSWQQKLEDVTTTISAAAARLPGADKSPAPLYYEIPVITTTQNKNIVINIKGVKLNNPKNYIVFANKRIPVTTIDSDQLISFNIPLTEADVFNPGVVNTFQLFLYQNRVIGPDKEFAYTPRFIVAPKFIAKVKVFYKTSIKKREEDNGIRRFSATSGSNREKEVKKTIPLKNSARDGWLLNRSSISCRKAKGKGDEHGASGPLDGTITDINFQAKAWATDGKAVCECRWKEYRIFFEDSVVTSETTINFNTQEIVELNFPPSSLVKTEVTYYDNSIFKTSDNSFSGNHLEFTFKLQDGLYEVRYRE